MRNLSQYPVTRAEQISTLRAVIASYEKSEAEEIGSMTAIVLETVLQDLYRVTAREEDIPITEEPVEQDEPSEWELDAAYDRGIEDAVNVWCHKLPPCPFPVGSQLAEAWLRGISNGDNT